MKHAKTAATVVLALAGLRLAGPRMQLGTKVAWSAGTGDLILSDTAGPIIGVVWMRQSVGPAVEVAYGPVWGLSGRLDLAEVSLFLSGGAAFRLLPMLGLDLMFEPPTSWRTKPYVWVGARLTGYKWLPRRDYPVFQHDSETHWRAGLGGKFRLTRSIELFAETQLYALDDWWEGVRAYPDRSWEGGCWRTEVIGLAGANVGARFALAR